MTRLLWQVKLKAMKSHEAQVAKMKQDGVSLSEMSSNTDAINATITDFTGRWESTFKRIGELGQ